MKHVVQYGVFAAYHLALETSFLADEGASLPEIPLNSPLAVALPDKSSSIERSISMIPGFTVPMKDNEPSRLNSLPMSDVFSSIMNQKSAKMLLPLGSNLHNFQNIPQTSVLDSSSTSILPKLDVSDVTKLDSSEPVTSNGDLNKSSPFSDGMENVDQLLDVKNGSSKEEFPPTPSDHQSILVSLSSRCVWKGTVCERSHLFRIKYYGNFDKPLGRFLRDDLFDQVRDLMCY